jgi:hypothetical protein
MLFSNWSLAPTHTRRFCGNILVGLVGLLAGASFHSSFDRAQAYESQLGIQTESANGNPFGVGLIKLPLSQAFEMGWFSDQTIEVKSRQSKIWLPAVQERMPPRLESSDNPDAENELLVYFLYSGRSPASVQVVIAGKSEISVPLERSVDDSAKHAKLLHDWWSVLCEQTYRGIAKPLVVPSEDFLAILGQRMKLSPIGKASARKTSASQLEDQFERTMGMLLGFESIRLAMMIDESSDSVGRVPAMYPLPNPVGIASLRTPIDVSNSTSQVESLAWMVPEDCFYVRCRSIQNYSWLRQLAINWGGSLEEIVTSPSLDSRVRDRLESQLGIQAEASIKDGLDKHLNDMALIGSDVFFEEGAGIGVLLEAKPGHERDVEQAIQKQRTATRLGHESRLHSESIRGHSVSFLTSHNQQMRSWYVQLGRYSLITNSRELMTTFLNLQKSSRSIANLPEYRYAIATNPEANQSEVTIYLPDPFFRRITSPSFRIELNRRRLAARECRQLEIAALLSKSFGYKADSRQSLIDGNFLPADFGLRPDGGSVELVSGEAMDSLRGRVGTFVPVADMQATKANEIELNAYHRFSMRYQQEWPAMDPVLACLRHERLADQVERVYLSIHVTPYARKQYAFLSNYLAEPSATHIGIHSGELVGVSASLRNHSKRFLAHFGICDTTVPFQIRHGELIRDREESSGTFVQQRSFAAVTPAGNEGLQLLSGLIKSLQNRHSELPPQKTVASVASTARELNPFLLLHRIYSPADSLIRMTELAIHGLIDVTKINSIYEDATWSIYGSHLDLRQEVRHGLVQEQLSRPTQMCLHAGGLERAAIASYLHAYSYCVARQQSAANAAWLNRWTTGLRAQPKTFRASLEQALQANLRCPLQGNFVLQRKPLSVNQWVSSAWRESELAAVKGVPPEYRFPFLHWMKKVELNFNLSSTSLKSELVLEVSHPMETDLRPLGP